MALGYAWFDSYDSVGYVLTLHIFPPYSCHDSSRVSAMPTNRAYGTCYAIATNMLTHGLHGPHAVIIMDLDVHGHALYKYRHDTLQPPMVA